MLIDGYIVEKVISSFKADLKHKWYQTVTCIKVSKENYLTFIIFEKKIQVCLQTCFSKTSHAVINEIFC